MTFSHQLNQLFFGFDITDQSSSLFDSLLSVPQLHHSDNGVRQQNLNITIEMRSDKAWSSRHKFSFTESPLPNLKIETGTIEVVLGETDSTKKILDLNWQLQFSDKAAAAKCFKKLKQIFSNVATKKKYEHDKDVGDVAQFSTRSKADTGIRDITLLLDKSLSTNKYEITLVLVNDFIREE
ncbi:hypothetical protein [Foetidibacter luteolus]|uniref:hypothetical protein n=1 Tax=Foetidibacter luteolus TaxID=2608880 RepID=UPI00129B3D3F|nr:hypothetical protein [Foetidibacter luteolus]